MVNKIIDVEKSMEGHRMSDTTDLFIVQLTVFSVVPFP